MKSHPRTLRDFRRLGRKLCPDPRAAKAKHDARQAARAAERRSIVPTLVRWLRTDRSGNPPSCAERIPLGGHNIHHTAYTRAKNWEGAVSSCVESRAMKIDNGQYSRRCKYTHWTYRMKVQSWGIVLNGTLRATIDTGNGVRTWWLFPWRGWAWHIDANGIYLADAHGRRDYHPTAATLLECDTTAAIAELARNTDAKRREAAAMARKEAADFRRAEQEGITVCLADSLAAGNCLAGTLNWANRHGLQAGRHYTPREILAVANGDTSRVRIVLAVAVRRHRNEMRQGYSDLSYHHQQ